MTRIGFSLTVRPHCGGGGVAVARGVAHGDAIARGLDPVPKLAGRVSGMGASKQAARALSEGGAT